MQWHDAKCLQQHIRQEEIPRTALVQCLSNLLRNFSGTFRKVADELPICAREEEDENDIGEEEEEVLLENGIFNPAASTVALEIRESFKESDIKPIQPDNKRLTFEQEWQQRVQAYNCDTGQQVLHDRADCVVTVH